MKTIDDLGLKASVEWANTQELADIKYNTDVPFVPRKTEQAIVDVLVPSQMEQLLAERRNLPWAHFAPFEEYGHHLKRLFQQGKLIPRFNAEESTERLDAFFEEGEMADDEAAEKLYEIFQVITHFDEIAKEIALNLLSCVKS